MKELNENEDETLKKILGYLDKFEWQPESVSENNGEFTITLIANLDIKEVKIFIKFSFNGLWIFFSSKFLASIKSNYVEIYKKLLEINYTTTLTKFGLAENGEVYALAELPITTLDYEEFVSALRRLTNDVNTYLLPIANLMSTNSD